MTEKPAVLIAQRHLAPLAPILGARYDVYCLWEAPPVEAAHAVRALVTDGGSRLDPKILDGLPALGLIASFTAGYEGVDVADARSRGLQLSYAPGANSEDVADHAMALILAGRRGVVAGDRRVRDGGWTTMHRTFTPSLHGQTAGILGLGRIGQAVARRCEAFGLVVRWWGPNPKPEVPWPRSPSLLDLGRESDILVLAAPLDDTSRGTVGREVLEALGPKGLLVNVGRGALVDEDALVAALKDGRLGGAALDVFVEEPTPAARWADVPNVILTPHCAGATDRAGQAMVEMLLANLDAFFAGRPLPSAIED